MAKRLVSVCLMGENCKYNGGDNYNAAAAEYGKAEGYRVMDAEDIKEGVCDAL